MVTSILRQNGTISSSRFFGVMLLLTNLAIVSFFTSSVLPLADESYTGEVLQLTPDTDAVAIPLFGALTLCIFAFLLNLIFLLALNLRLARKGVDAIHYELFYFTKRVALNFIKAIGYLVLLAWIVLCILGIFSSSFYINPFVLISDLILFSSTSASLACYILLVGAQETSYKN